MEKPVNVWQNVNKNIASWSRRGYDRIGQSNILLGLKFAPSTLIRMESKGLRRKTKLNALFLFVVFILIYRKFDSRASNRFNQFALLPSLIYNRTLRAAEHTRHRFLLFGSAEPEIDPVTLVENYKKIEERFNRRRIFLKEHCENLNLNGSLAANVHHDGSALDAIWNNVLAGK